MYVIHFQTESTENYYYYSKDKPTPAALKEKALQLCINEGFDEKSLEHIDNLCGWTVVEAKEL